MNFTKITDFLDHITSRQDGEGIPACDLTIWREHRPLYRHASGFADAADTKRMTGNEMYCLYSATKVITSAAAMQLIETGKLALDAPVGRWFPSFNRLTVSENGKIRPTATEMTVLHLLTMTGGFDYNFGTKDAAVRLFADGKTASAAEVTEALARSPLTFDPGKHFLYSLCMDAVGGLIEAVSGETLGDYFENHIFRPLGMRSTTFHPTAEQAARILPMYLYHDETHTSELLPQPWHNFPGDPYESGGEGLYSCVDDYILFADALANGGVGATGERILTQDSIDLMRTPRLSPVQKKEFDGISKIGYSYGLGVRTMVDRSIENARSPIGEFGWDGAAGAYVMIDPEHHLSLFYAQHACSCCYTFQTVFRTLRDLAYDCAEIRC